MQNTLHKPPIGELEFTRFVEENQERLLAWAASLLKDEAWAKDCLQLVWAKVWRELPKFRGESSLRSWVNQICFRTCLDLLRFAQRERRYLQPINGFGTDDLEWQPKEFIANRDQEPDQVALAADLRESLNQLAGKLSANHGEVVRLLLAGLTQKEIAQILNISHGTVRVRCFRARRDLKQILAEGQHQIELQ